MIIVWVTHVWVRSWMGRYGLFWRILIVFFYIDAVTVWWFIMGLSPRFMSFLAIRGPWICLVFNDLRPNYFDNILLSRFWNSWLVLVMILIIYRVSLNLGLLIPWVEGAFNIEVRLILVLILISLWLLSFLLLRVSCSLGVPTVSILFIQSSMSLFTPFIVFTDFILILWMEV